MRTTGVATIAATLALAVSACASSSSPSAPATPTTAHATSVTPTPTPPPGAAVTCGWPDAVSRLVSLRTGDGVRLFAYEAGAGPHGVLLEPEAGTLGSCGWWPFAAYLAAHGFHVLAFDHRCQAASACPATVTPPDALLTDMSAAFARLRADGAVKIALAGGSQGGAEAILAAARHTVDITGVAILSADVIDSPLAPGPGPLTAIAAAHLVRVPVFAAVAVNDPAISADDTRHLFDSMPGHTRLVIVPLGGHGWDLVNPVNGGQTPALAATLAAFLASVTR